VAEENGTKHFHKLGKGEEAFKEEVRSLLVLRAFPHARKERGVIE